MKMVYNSRLLEICLCLVLIYLEGEGIRRVGWGLGLGFRVSLLLVGRIVRWEIK